MKTNNTPKLRFKEFTDGWQEKKLGDSGVKVIDGDRGANYPNGNDFSDFGHCLFLNAKNVTDSGFSFLETSFITAQKDTKMRKGKLEESDLVLTTRGTVGNVAFFNETIPYRNMRVNSGMVILRSEPEKVDPNYLYLLSNSPVFINQIKKISFGSAQPQLTVKDIQKLKLPIPNIKEQQKIADFLTEIDDKIGKLDENKKAFEKYKKGIMQAIFSQKIRFKKQNGKLAGRSLGEGGDFPDWEEKKFDDIFASVPTKPYQILNNQFESTGSYPVVDQGQQKIAGYINDSKKVFTNLPVVVFGDHTTFLKYIDFKFVVGADGTKLLKSKNKDDLSFLFYALEFHKIKPEGYKRHYSILRTLEFLMPELREQQKIAEFLTSLDNKVNLINNQLEQAKLFKKSLLQKMFV